MQVIRPSIIFTYFHRPKDLPGFSRERMQMPFPCRLIRMAPWFVHVLFLTPFQITIISRADAA